MKTTSKNPLRKTANHNKSHLLDKRIPPFNLCFQHKLASGYTLAELSSGNIKALQRFLDKISKMTFAEVDKLYLRKADSQDAYEGVQVIHYAITDKFRIHGIIEGEKFCVIRLDPNHKFHE